MPKRYVADGVSTHSRPKAAGMVQVRRDYESYRFNTQPPEGGWSYLKAIKFYTNSFNTQPPEGGWKCLTLTIINAMCFNTQPPEGGWKKPHRF